MSTKPVTPLRHRMIEDMSARKLCAGTQSASICNRNRIMTGLRFLFRVTLRRLDLANGSITSVSRRRYHW